MNKNHQLSVMKVSSDSSPASPFLSKIVPQDQQLLENTVRHFNKNSKNYEDSWGYIIQATRYSGFKWYDPDTGSLIFFGKKSDNDPTLIVPNFFATPSYLAAIVKNVQQRLGISKTILKNINTNTISHFTYYGFRPYYNNERWSDIACFDDQTYPQLIIDLKQLAEKKGKSYHLLRKALNKQPGVTVRKYSAIDEKEVLEIFSLRDTKLKNTSEKNMYFVSHAMYPEANIDKFVINNSKSGEILGFIATSDICSDNIALVASIFKPEFKIDTINEIADQRTYIVSIWGIYHALIAKYQEGFRLANLGGNETIGPYTFLGRTFNPVQKLEKTHLIYDQQTITGLL